MMPVTFKAIKKGEEYTVKIDPEHEPACQRNHQQTPNLSPLGAVYNSVRRQDWAQTTGFLLLGNSSLSPIGTQGATGDRTGAIVPAAVPQLSPGGASAVTSPYEPIGKGSVSF